MRDTTSSLAGRLLRLHRSGPSQSSSLAAVFFLLVCAVGASAAAASAHTPTPSIRTFALRETLQTRRAAMLDRLHAYWTAGDFVQNPEPNGGPGHFLIDGRGTPCPLASIIIRSGRGDLVEEAARTNNNVKVVDLQDGPIMNWILSSGLTKEECILIQRPGRSGAEVATPVTRAEHEQLRKDLQRVEATLRVSSEKGLTVSVRRMLAAQKARI